MRLKKDNTAQKLRGAYYTPLQLANAMVSLFASDNIERVLEPSCGDGVFIDSLVQHGLMPNIKSITAVEIEASEVCSVKKRYTTNKAITVLNEDFFDFYNRSYTSSKYDLILGNPPYIRYQYLTEKQREIQSKILTTQGMKSNKLINAWVCFMVACVQMLADKGKLAFVVPAEILQVAYAEDLRLFLSNEFTKITLITFEKLVFPEIEQEVVVFVGEKGGEEEGIRVVEISDLDGFDSLNLHKNGCQKLLHAKEKWTKYFISADEVKTIQNIREDSRFVKFSDYGIINIGITTGNNNYFSIDQRTALEFDLEPVTLPLIGRSSHAHGIFFTKDDWEANLELQKKARLIDFPDIPLNKYPLKHKNYIKLGEENEEHVGYKCSIRDRWYRVPSIWVPDAFFLRRNNLYPKFVLNRCGAVSTDTMHRMKFNEGIEPENVLLSYYNSISFAFTEVCGRSYGGGVLEILPGEMGNILLPRVENVDLKLRKKLLGYVDEVVRNNKNIERALDLVDQELLVNTLGIDSGLCSECRAIWKKLQKRRLSRSYR